MEKEQMTREEAIFTLQQAVDETFGAGIEIITRDGCEAVEMAIEALKQEPVLDKIRVEIKAMFPPSGDWMYGEEYEHEHTVCEVLSDVLQIIDKYIEADKEADEC